MPAGRRAVPRRLSGRLAAFGGAWVAAVLILLAVHIVIPQRSGFLALTEVFEPYILFTGLLAAAVALAGRVRWRMALVAVLIAAVVIRYGPIVVSLPGSAGGRQLSVVTLNILAGQRDGLRFVNGLGERAVDLVGLQELQPEAVDVINSNGDLLNRYPYRVLEPDWSVYGIGLLSRHPIVEHQFWSDPPLVRAVVAPTGSEQLTVFVAHPPPARIRTIAGLPVSLDTTGRDRDIAFIRSLIDVDLATGRDVVVLGDFNVTEREPAYGDLSAGLRDAHLDAGLGLGHTWRPEQLNFLPLGVFRIDYVLSSVGYQAVSTHVECTGESDHCLLAATLVER
jgi:endonuclease/exonuclease/phosphatase family metal-dependent hydrolase